MRIGIDVRYLSHGLVGGVHTYVANFVPALIETAREHPIFLYADTKRPFELHDMPENVTVRLLSYHNPLSSIANDLFLARTAARDELDVIHFPANHGLGPRGTRTVITLHDAINLMPLPKIVRGHRKDARSVAMMTYLHLFTRASIRRADLVLTVSEHARREIAHYGGCDINRIVAVHHGPPPDLCRVTDAEVLSRVRKRYAIEKPFVLADGLKNPGVLLRAWHFLPLEMRTKYQIVFFARSADVLPVVEQAVMRGEARLLVNPPRADLIALYSMADVFVFPSWIEGFGIPLLEAMTCGAPVIASDRGAIPEVAGDAALLADAEDEETFAQHLTRVLSDPAEAQRLRMRGYARAAQFSWHKTAQRIFASYEQAVTGKSLLLSEPQVAV